MLGRAPKSLLRSVTRIQSSPSVSNFETAKIGFALALLGVVFTVHPIAAPYLSHEVSVFGMGAPVRFFYLSFVGALVFSVYLYALDLLVERPKSLLRSAGNVSYAIALAIPLLTAFFVVVTPMLRWIGERAESLVEASSVVASTLGAIAALLAERTIQRAIRLKDRASSEMQARLAEADHIGRAQQMLSLGHFDLAALEAWTAVEIAIRAALMRTDLRLIAVMPAAQFDQAVKVGIVPPETAELARSLRGLRNQAAHGRGQIAREDATNAVSNAIRILGDIRRPGSDEATA